ncbi:uncharacterized protein B0H18DRAFT_332313 [Fomitopsis serialis]|uniref:uncharacterized protein n=1 Tax=Fomitopsis serialis TaxID=139415 RepID=UPI0020077CBA|nr:uncharacterized protein B0H18DRAFT_332313 [Neoantrodia serialis]KAH9926759.1 hypothetical protein B0H18DRAFT_332313 [Neoantrodia serialis]
MPEHTEHSPRGQSSTATTAYNRLVHRYLREDNRHIWLSCCVAVSSCAFFPLSLLVARRIPRLATTAWAREAWGDKDGVIMLLQTSAFSGWVAYYHARWRQYERMEEKDVDFRTISRANFLSMDRFKLQSPGSSWSVVKAVSLPADNLDSPIDIIERIGMNSAKLWTSPTRLWVMRKTLEDDLRKHGVSQSDIERIVILLGGAPDCEKHVFVGRLLSLACVAGGAWPFFIMRPRPRWLRPGIALAMTLCV